MKHAHLSKNESENFPHRDVVVGQANAQIFTTLSKRYTAAAMESIRSTHRIYLISDHGTMDHIARLPVFSGELLLAVWSVFVDLWHPAFLSRFFRHIGVFLVQIGSVHLLT